MYIIVQRIYVIVAHYIALLIFFLYLYHNSLKLLIKLGYISPRWTIYRTNYDVFTKFKYIFRDFNEHRFHTIIKTWQIFSMKIIYSMFHINRYPSPTWTFPMYIRGLQSYLKWKIKIEQQICTNERNPKAFDKFIAIYDNLNHMFQAHWNIEAETKWPTISRR